MEPGAETGEVGAGTDTVPVDSTVEAGNADSTSIPGDSARGSGVQGALPIRPGHAPISDTVCGDDSDNWAEIEPETAPSEWGKTEGEETDPDAECSEVLPVGSPSATAASQVIVNLTTLEVIPVNWPGYPALAQIGAVAIVQVWVCINGVWKRAVPIASGAPGEVVVTQCDLLSLVSALR